jgi:hypothetical protein
MKGQKPPRGERVRHEKHSDLFCHVAARLLRCLVDSVEARIQTDVLREL